MSAARRPLRGSASRSNSRPAAHTRTIVISPEVSVLVLSVHTTVVEPRVSTAGRRRTSACRRAIRRMPTASAIVATAGRASGTAATARAMPVSITSPSGAPCTAPSVATAAATPSASQTSRRPSASSRRSSGVRSSWTELTSVPMRPTSVCGAGGDHDGPAGARRDRRALEHQVAALGERRWPLRIATSARLEIGSDSPVSAASETRRSMVDTSRASAGTRCPAVTSMTSPGTSVCGVDQPQLSLADNSRARDVEIEQRLHRAAGAPLGQEADERVDDEYRGDRRGFEPIAKKQ